jgi:hypothetical protein
MGGWIFWIMFFFYFQYDLAFDCRHFSEEVYSSYSWLGSSNRMMARHGSWPIFLKLRRTSGLDRATRRVASCVSLVL